MEFLADNPGDPATYPTIAEIEASVVDPMPHVTRETLTAVLTDLDQSMGL